jgi:hypothetical protein
MEHPHIDSIGPDNSNGGKEEPLSDYVKRMETEENLKKLAQKLEGNLKKPGDPEAAAPDLEAPDLSFSKFEEKRKQRDGQ